MFARLLILGIVALAYGRPQDVQEDVERLYVPDERCPPAQDHHLLPHEYDCTKYYYCEYGLRYLEPTNCAPGTEFSFEQQVCIHPSQANCTLPGPPTSGPTSSPSSTASPSPSTTAAPRPPSTSTAPPPPSTSAAPPPPSTSAAPPPPTTSAAPSPPPTTAAPGNGTLPNGCPSDFDIDWRLPHECDCDKYYRCMYGRKVLKQCPPGLHFNRVKQICELPSDAGCDGSDPPATTYVPSSTTSTAAPTPSPTTAAPSPSPTTAAPSPSPTTSAPSLLPNGCPSNFSINWHLPHETDCWKFYQCVHGEKVERACGPGLAFDPVRQVCVLPSETNCTLPETTPPAPSSTAAPGPSSTTAAPSPSPTTSAPSLLPNGCPSNFSINWHLPHETDCWKFYQCVHGQKVEMVCGPGLAFDPVRQVCVLPSETNCTLPGTTPPAPSSTAAPGPSSTTAAPSPSPTTSAPSLLPNGCPSDFSINWHLPHETDCWKFYQCVHGQKVEMVCGPGLAFDPVRQVCVLPSETNCTLPGTTPPAPSSTAAPGPSSTTAAPSPSPTTSAPSLLPNGCPSDFSINWHLPHERDCRKFYQCVHGQKVEMACGPGLVFDPVRQVCVYPSETNCTLPGSTTTSAPKPSPTTAAPTPSPSSAAPTPSPSTAAPTPSPSTAAPTPSPSTAAPTPSPSSAAPTPSPSTAAPTPSPSSAAPTPSPSTAAPSPTTSAPGNGTLPNGCPSDFDINWRLPHECLCDRYYECMYGRKVLQHCPSGLHFNRVKQICELPADAGCEECPESTTLPIPSSTAAPSPSPTTAAPSPSPTTAAPSPSPTTAAPSPSPTTAAPSPSPTTAAPSPSPTTAAPSPSPTTAAPSPSPTTAAPTPSPTTAAPIPTPIPDRCVSECHVAHWPHETDCDKFWRCEGNKSVLGVCSEGLYFNRLTQTCDFHCNVDCVKNVVQSTPEREGLRVFLPWNKVDKLVELSNNGEFPEIFFQNF